MPVLVPAQFNRQCIWAAYSSRLSPYALHAGEHAILNYRLDDTHIKVYLQIRNAILRLWTRNPLVAVTQQEASECTKDRRYIQLALVAYEWLARNGYINFGCVEIPEIRYGYAPKLAKPRTIVIIGAGVSGLTCARQLQAIFHQFPERWIKHRREHLPRVVLLEGRNRVGGRVYTHPLRHQKPGSLPHGLANTVELGAQIITGFDHGNPLDAIVRGQLALEYHLLKDNMLLHDCDGAIIDERRDARIQNLFNEILEIASDHPTSWKPAIKVPTENGFRSTLAPAKDIGAQQKPSLFPGLTQNGIRPRADVEISQFPPSLGSLMDQMVNKFQQEQDFKPLDMRLMNWHYANLEYANAINVNELSLGGWDQDSGNEFEGRHSMLVGGYGQVVRALLESPTLLDVRLNKVVEKVVYNDLHQQNGNIDRPARIICSDGETFSADHVISTLSLGVLQYGNVKFEPELPVWKTSAMQRLGFGVLNKVILAFSEPFWPRDRDMFGLCNQPDSFTDSLHQQDYTTTRGRFYMFWNCLKTSGQPVLVGLMAGDAAQECDRAVSQESQAILVGKATAILATMFKLPEPPRPVEAVVTRWRSDPFARGSYSYLGPNAQPGDYETMAKGVGNLHFAGEATCGTHPATVHGALISGLRAAAEVAESLIGPVACPQMATPPMTNGNAGHSPTNRNGMTH